MFPPQFVDTSVNDMNSTALPHDHDIKVGPDVIDFMGHVNNAHYLSWVQEAVLAHWRHIAPPEAVAGHRWVAPKHDITYHRPALPDHHVLAHVRPKKMQGSHALYK